MPRNNVSCLAHAIIYQNLFPPRLEKKNFLCTVTFPFSGRNWNSKKLLAGNRRRDAYILYIHSPPDMHFPTASPQVRADVVPPVAKTPASAHSSVEESCCSQPVARRNRARLQYCSSEILPPQACPHMAIDTHNPGPAILGTGRWKLSWKPTPRVTI